MPKYLDKDGLEEFFDNIKDLVHGPSYSQVSNWMDAHPDVLSSAIAADVADATDNWLDEHPEATSSVQDGSVSFNKLADAVHKGYVRSFETVADMQSATDLKTGMTCHTNGFHASGDGGAAYYTVGTSGTANGMDVLALQGGLFAAMVVTEPYVMPEMFGAWGDGTHDDAAAINRMFTVGKSSFLFSQRTYKIGTTIDVDAQGITITGNGCTIASGSVSALHISETSHDIEIIGVNFMQSFEVGSTNTSNYGIGILGSSATALYQAYNIRIFECSFTGGVFGINATNCQNLEIGNCKFGSFVYKPSNSAGGYAILEQSCVNVYVHDCYFNTGNYGRHSVYISVSQNKTDNIKSQNVSVVRCVFDNSDMSTQSSGAFYSDNTSAVVIRYSVSTKIDCCTLIGGTALVSATDNDGAISATITNCTVINGKFIAETTAPNEGRSAININCSNVASKFKIDRCNVESADTLYNDASLAGGTIEYSNSNARYLIFVGNVVRLFMHDVKVNNNGTIRYTGSGVLIGKFERIIGEGAYTFPYVRGRGNVDFTMYDDDARSGFYLVSDGGIRFPSRPHLPVSASTDAENNIVFTFTGLSGRPYSMHVESMGLYSTKLYSTNINSMSGNELKMRVFDTNGAQITTGFESKITF